MKHTTAIFGFVLSSFALAACNEIGEDERYIYVEPPVDTTSYIKTWPKAVLIEDFTGQRCVNCPTATELIESLMQQVEPGRIVPVGIHSEPMGFVGNASNVGLMNDESKEYGRYWQVETQPIGLVNRRGGLKGYNDWTTIVAEELAKQVPIGIELKSAYDPENTCATIDVEVLASEDLEGSLQLWLVQGNITAMQVIPSTGKADKSYVHNHVFRSCINGMWGEELAIGGGNSHKASYTVSLDNEARPQFSPEYIPADCSIVAFVYNNEGVQQVVMSNVETE